MPPAPALAPWLPPGNSGLQDQIAVPFDAAETKRAQQLFLRCLGSVAASAGSPTMLRQAAMTLVIEIANLLSAQHTTTTMVISSNCTASDILRQSLLSRWRALYVLWPLILRMKQSAKNSRQRAEKAPSGKAAEAKARKTKTNELLNNIFDGCVFGLAGCTMHC